MPTAALRIESLLIALLALAGPLFAGETAKTAEAEAASPRIPLNAIESIKGLIPQSTHVTIDPSVGLDGPYYVFTIRSPHAEYTVVSFAQLRKICAEIDAIERFRTTENGEKIWRNAREKIGKSGDKQKSDKSVGRVFGRFGRSIGRLVGIEDKKKTAKDDSATSDGEKTFAAPARELAYRYRFDVYTDNPYAQGLLKEVERDRWKGRLATSGSLPTAAGASLSLTLTPSGRREPVELRLRDTNLPELRRLILKDAETFLQPDEAQRKAIRRIVNNPNYTPREIAYTWNYLLDMRDVEGFWDAVDFFGAIRFVDDARLGALQMELLWALHRGGNPIKRFVVIDNAQIGGIDKDSLLEVPAPYDYVDETPVFQNLRRAIVLAAKRIGAPQAELLLTGDASVSFVNPSHRQGVRIISSVLRRSIFQKTIKADRLPAAEVKVETVEEPFELPELDPDNFLE